MSVDSEFERSEDEDSNGRVRASKLKTCETGPARGSLRPEAELLFVLDLEVEGDFPLPAFFFGEKTPPKTCPPKFLRKPPKIIRSYQ